MSFTHKTHIKLYKNTFLTWIKSTQIPIRNYKHICTLYIVQQKKGSLFNVCISPYNQFKEFDRKNYKYYFWSMMEQITGSGWRETGDPTIQWNNFCSKLLFIILVYESKSISVQNDLFEIIIATASFVLSYQHILLYSSNAIYIFCDWFRHKT